MLQSIPVEYNGHVFVPMIQIELPEGTVCVAHIPTHKPPPPVTDDHRSQWAELCAALDATEPRYSSAEEEMAAIRGRS
jgi:hypothetical protein